MSIETLKEEVLAANLDLVTKNLVISTWGNVSGYDGETGVMVIKASGVPYDKMTKEHMVTVDLDGNVIDILNSIEPGRTRGSAGLYTLIP